MANDSFRRHITNDASVFIHSGEKKFVTQYRIEKKVYRRRRGLRRRQKNESRAKRLKAACLSSDFSTCAHTTTRHLAFNYSEENRPQMFKEINWLFEIMNVFVYIKIYNINILLNQNIIHECQHVIY